MRAKISAEHLDRTALVYVRQSTPAQVREHLESQRRPYALARTRRTVAHHAGTRDECARSVRNRCLERVNQRALRGAPHVHRTGSSARLKAPLLRRRCAALTHAIRSRG
jgi:hypothetical protein